MRYRFEDAEPLFLYCLAGLGISRVVSIVKSLRGGKVSADADGGQRTRSVSTACSIELVAAEKILQFCNLLAQVLAFTPEIEGFLPASVLNGL